MKSLSDGIDCFSRCVRIVAKYGFLVVLPAAFSSAKTETDPAPEAADSAKVIAELIAAYAKQGGYIATYHSEGDGKSLDCTVASDMVSGMGVTHLTAVKGNQKMEGKFWSAANDRMFVEGDGGLFVVKGFHEQCMSIRDLRKVFIHSDDTPENGTCIFTPGMLLQKTTISPSFGIRTKSQPPWTGEVEDAPIQASDETTVTFLTKEHGLLTISRQNGMLVRQSLKGENGEARVLELRSLQPNPGKEAILKISADWPTAGAKEKNVIAWMAPLRLALFQLVIDSAEHGQIDKDKLDDLLEEQYEALRNFAKACLNEREGPFATKANWPDLFAKVKTVARKKWLEDTPGADSTDEKGFLEYLQKPEFRLLARNSVVEGILTPEEAPETIMDDVFGRGGWASLKVGNDFGVAAKKSLVNALSRAYLEALVDLKMAKQWDQRDGLD